MKRILALALFLAFLTLSFSFPAPVTVTVSAAVSAKVDLITANPGENCNTRIGISWMAAPDCVSAFVEYMPADEDDWGKAEKANGLYNEDDYNYLMGKKYDCIGGGSGVVFGEQHKFLNYNANLKNLTPATRYQYRVGDGLGGYAETRYFKTSGAEEFSFVWISDTHIYTPLQGRLNAANSAINYAISQAPGQTVDMVFTTGDMVAYGSTYTNWRDMYGTSWAKNHLFVNTNGNHDDMSDTLPGTVRDTTFNYFRIMHNNPQNCYLGTSAAPYEPGVVYWFLYNNILWFVLDNETMSGVRPQIQEWMGKVIESMKGRYQYLFLTEHYQWFTGETGALAHYNNWYAFCDKYGVDVAFSGNNHVYVRSNKLYQNKVVPDGDPNGTFYVQAPSSDCERGHSAAFSATPSNADFYACRYNYPKSLADLNGGVYRTHGVSLVTVGQNGVTLNMYASENNSATSPAFVQKDSAFFPAKRGYISQEICAPGTHSFNDWAQAVPPTRTSVGESERSCTVCLSFVETQEIPKLCIGGHTFGAWSVTTAPTLLEEGEQKRTCSVCNLTEKEAIAKLCADGHSFGDWTATIPPERTCDICGTVEIGDAGETYTLGDVNGDGKIDAVDASLILQYDARLIGEDGLIVEAADVNGDGKTDAVDASLILQYDARLIDSFE